MTPEKPTKTRMARDRGRLREKAKTKRESPKANDAPIKTQPLALISEKLDMTRAPAIPPKPWKVESRPKTIGPAWRVFRVMTGNIEPLENPRPSVIRIVNITVLTDESRQA